MTDKNKNKNSKGGPDDGSSFEEDGHVDGSRKWNEGSIYIDLDAKGPDEEISSGVKGDVVEALGPLDENGKMEQIKKAEALFLKHPDFVKAYQATEVVHGGDLDKRYEVCVLLAAALWGKSIEGAWAGVAIGGRSCHVAEAIANAGYMYGGGVDSLRSFIKFMEDFSSGSVVKIKLLADACGVAKDKEGLDELLEVEEKKGCLEEMLKFKDLFEADEDLYKSIRSAFLEYFWVTVVGVLSKLMGKHSPEVPKKEIIAALKDWDSVSAAYNRLVMGN